jgi:hypothetical protein
MDDPSVPLSAQGSEVVTVAPVRSPIPIEAAWILLEYLPPPEREAVAAFFKRLASIAPASRQFLDLPSKMFLTSGILAYLTIEGWRLWDRFANDRQAAVDIKDLSRFAAACDENANNCSGVVRWVAAATPDDKRSAHQEASDFLYNVAAAIRMATPRVAEIVVRAALHNAAITIKLESDIESVLTGILKEATRIEGQIPDPEPEPSGLEALRMSILGISDPKLLPKQQHAPSFSISQLPSGPVELLASTQASVGPLPQESKRLDAQEPACDDKGQPGNGRAPAGWSFEPGRTAFMGIEIGVKGKALKTLRHVASAKHGIRSSDLANCLARDREQPLEATTIRGHIAAVRRALRQAFNTAGKDPIPALDRGENLGWKIDESVLRPR